LSTTTAKQSPKLDKKATNQLQVALPALVIGLASSVQVCELSVPYHYTLPPFFFTPFHHEFF
jgi:hypothetical protein